MPDPSHSGSFLLPILVFLAAAVVAVQSEEVRVDAQR
jgi:hypothetical protein